MRKYIIHIRIILKCYIYSYVGTLHMTQKVPLPNNIIYFYKMDSAVFNALIFNSLKFLIYRKNNISICSSSRGCIFNRQIFHIRSAKSIGLFCGQIAVNHVRMSVPIIAVHIGYSSRCHQLPGFGHRLPVRVTHRSGAIGFPPLFQSVRFMQRTVKSSRLPIYNVFETVPVHEGLRVKATLEKWQLLGFAKLYCRGRYFWLFLCCV